MVATVNVNGLGLCHQKSDGFVMSTIPDICKTPAGSTMIPLPYVITGYSKDLANGSSSVKADGGASCAIVGSEFAKTTGDEPGSGGGMTSGTVGGKATWLSWSPNVLIEGKNACRLTDKMLMNQGNASSLGGEQQPKWQGGDDKYMDEICEMACECLSEGRGQECLDEKIEYKYYDKNRRYPLDPYDGIWREVSMERKFEEKLFGDLVWQIITNKKGTGNVPTSNPFTPQDGIRPDAITMRNGRPDKLIEVKFPGDRLNYNQKFNYPDAADDIDADYEVLEVDKDCNCGSHDPEPEPEPVKVKEEEKEEEKEEQKEIEFKPHHTPGALETLGAIALAIALGIAYVVGGLIAIITSPLWA